MPAGAIPGSATGTERRVFDLLDPEFYRGDPQEAYAWMRANEPVYRDDRNGVWGITKHADIQEVERLSSVFVSSMGYRVNWSPAEINMIAQDNPRHQQQRHLVQGQLTRKGIEPRMPSVRALVDELLDAIDSTGGADVEVVGALSGQLPARTTCQLLGFPEEMWPQLKSWSERLMRTDMMHRDGPIFAEFMDANIEFMTAAGMIAPQKLEAAAQGCPMNDFMTIWLTQPIDGQCLSPEAVMHELGLFIAGGAETTRTAISHGLRVFADHPDQWDAMAADPSLVPGAVEEVLRWVTPLNNMFRRASVDHEIRGVRIRRGDRLALLYPAANRDEDVFADPHTFDIRRSPNPQIAFGFGTHLCVGANFARASLETVFGEMSRRYRVPAVLAEPDVEANIFARAVKSFRVSLTPR